MTLLKYESLIQSFEWKGVGEHILLHWKDQAKAAETKTNAEEHTTDASVNKDQCAIEE